MYDDGNYLYIASEEEGWSEGLEYTQSCSGGGSRYSGTSDIYYSTCKYVGDGFEDNLFVAQFIGENNTLTGTVEALSKNVATVKLEAGDTVKALAVNTDGKGGRTSLSIRPERCVVSPKKVAGLSMLKGRIEELIYLGDHIRCRMNVAGNDEFIVKVPNTADHLGLEIGTESYVGWQTDDCRALDFKQV